MTNAKELNLENLAPEKRKEIEVLLAEIERREKFYSITEFNYWQKEGKKYIPQQKQIVGDFISRIALPYDQRPRYYLYFWGNWAWKTAVGSFLTSVLAMGTSGSKFKLPFIWEKKLIWIGTKSWSNVKSTIEPYLLWDKSISRIPPEEIKKETRDNGILKAIELKNGTKIQIFTYDQGYWNWQWGTPDFIWMDEEPTDALIFTEALARTRDTKCEMVITMTPLSGLTRVYEYFFENPSEEVVEKTRIYQVSSLDNPFTDKTWTKGLTEEEYKSRVCGDFISPSGLVYNQFNRHIHVIPHIAPEELGSVRFYRSIDFGTSHPTWVIFLAQDEEDNLYVWDEVYGSNLSLELIRDEILLKTWGRSIEYTLGDAAAKRERFELGRLWIVTQPADKHSRGENEVSNRRAWILLINNLLFNRKLFISSNCVNLIKEFQTHYYKENWKRDGEVVKENDDLLDALRYLIFNIKKTQVVTKKEKLFNTKYKTTYRKEIVEKKKPIFF